MVKVKLLVAQSCPTLCIPWTITHQAPLSMGFFRQQHWSGLPFPSPGDLPDPGIEPKCPALKKTLYHLSHQGSTVMVGSTKKDAQCESCELSFIWGKMRTATRETAPQIILRNCFKEVVGEDQESRYKIWWRQSSMQSDFGEGKVQCNQILVKAKFNAIKRLFYKRFSASHEELLSSWRDSVQRLGSWSQFLKISNHRKTCSASFPGAWSASLLHPELLSGHVEGQQQHQHKVQGKCPWQVPVCSWQWYLWGQERTL